MNDVGGRSNHANRREHPSLQDESGGDDLRLNRECSCKIKPAPSLSLPVIWRTRSKKKAASVTRL